MKYNYHCSHCNATVEIIKPMSEASRHEYCKCGREMGKVYNAPSIKTGDGVNNEKNKPVSFSMLGFTYARLGEVSYVSFMRWVVYQRVGNAFSLFGMVFKPKSK